MFFNFLHNFNLQSFLMYALVFMFSISFHEASHAWMAYKLGDDTAKRSGRLSLNPFVHLDLMGTVLFLLAHIGYAKAVPFNPANFRKPKRDTLLVALAGPVSNLILATAGAFIYFIVIKYFPSYVYDPVYGIIVRVFELMYIWNVVLAAFNLLPLPPLDGYKILSAVLPRKIYFQIMDMETKIGLILLAIFIFAPRILNGFIFLIKWPLHIFVTETALFLIRILIFFINILS